MSTFQTNLNPSHAGYCFLSIRAIPEKNTWGWGGGGEVEDGRRYIFLWVVGVESFQIIWVIGVRPNLITLVVCVSLCGWGRKNIICQKKERSFYLI